MPAKAGIQKRFDETLDSRLRGNDNMAIAMAKSAGFRLQMP
jgi:hypothetical protein